MSFGNEKAKKAYTCYWETPDLRVNILSLITLFSTKVKKIGALD